MATKSFSYQHALGRAEALRHFQGFIPQLQRERPELLSDVQENWTTNPAQLRFKVIGFTVSLSVIVEDSCVVITADTQSFIMGKLEQALDERVPILLMA